MPVTKISDLPVKKGSEGVGYIGSSKERAFTHKTTENLRGE